MSDIIGKSIDRYHILEQLGEGGMATVYKAFDTRLERDVAIKIIRRNAFPPDQLDRILKRFEREAKSLARLSHPNIIKVIDYGEYNGAPYLVMEYMPGGTLKEKLKGKAMQWQEAVRLLIPIAQALEYAHEQKIIHRDIKPSNILLMQKGQPMLTDFGIAKILEVEETATLTGTGVGVGTPEYMAPEQWTGSATAQTDIYSLGVVLYEMVTGRKPYTADTPAAILLKQATEPLPRPGTYVSDLPDSVEKILLKALARKPQDRYQDAGAFVEGLETLLTGASKSREYSVAQKVSKTVESDLDTQDTYLQEETYATNFRTNTTDKSLPKPRHSISIPMKFFEKETKMPCPKWRSVLWITLTWVVACTIGVMIGVMSGSPTAIHSIYIGMIVGVIVGVIGGGCMVLILRSEKVLSDWKSSLWIMMSWIIGWEIGMLIFWGGILYRFPLLEFYKVDLTLAGASIGIIGSFGMVLVLRSKKVLSGWKNMFWIILSWAIGWSIGFSLQVGGINPFIGFIECGIIGGLIGGGIMIWRLRMEWRLNNL